MAQIFQSNFCARLQSEESTIATQKYVYLAIYQRPVFEQVEVESSWLRRGPFSEFPALFSFILHIWLIRF